MSDETLRWRRIETGSEAWRWVLNADDNCFYYRDYQASGGYQASESNQLVFNLKIAPQVETENSARWKHKLNAIEQCVFDFEQFFDSFIRTNKSLLIGVIPIPPSKVRSDPEYDDRMMVVANRLSDKYQQIDAHDAFERKASATPLHLGGTRRVSDAKDSMVLSDIQLDRYDVVFVIDDVITTGTSFVAYKELINECYPSLVVAGLF